MYKNHYILAAIQLDIIEDTVGYGQSDAGIILPNGNILEITSPIRTRAKYIGDLASVRSQRDAILSTTDWVGFTDTPESEMKIRLIEYRQQLRDITNQVVEGQDLHITWPTDPRVIKS
jgi:hypothetical protein